MSKYVVAATWDDAPHLTPEDRERLYASIPAYQRDARTKGIPQLGSGAIYPVPEDEVAIDDFEIPYYWPRSYGMDVGWNRTAGIWQAHDRDTDVVYLYSEYYRGQVEAPIHAEAFLARGAWIPGTIDPASRGRSQADGTSLLNMYYGLGLTLVLANNAVEAGIFEVWTRLSTGRLRVFKSCRKWFEEYRLYRRDEKGKIVKDNDHLMDATRYLVMTGLAIERMRPADTVKSNQRNEYDPLNF